MQLDMVPSGKENLCRQKIADTVLSRRKPQKGITNRILYKTPPRNGPDRGAVGRSELPPPRRLRSEYVETYRAALLRIAPPDRLSASKTAFSYRGSISLSFARRNMIFRASQRVGTRAGETVTICHALQRVRRPILDPMRRCDSTKKGRFTPSFDCMLFNVPFYMLLSRSAFRSSGSRCRMICAAVLLFRRPDPRNRFFRMPPKDPA